MTDLMALSFMESPKSNNVGLLLETENEISSHRTICSLLFFHKDHRSFKVFLKQPELPGCLSNFFQITGTGDSLDLELTT
jgi:hypothetical protein